jgi:hypothetical protein
VSHRRNRDVVLQELREELVGPEPRGELIDCSVPIRLSKEDFYKPWRQKATEEEILGHEAPVVRYGVGVLAPLEARSDVESEEQSSEEDDAAKAKLFGDSAETQVQAMLSRANRESNEEEDDEFDLSTANARYPSSMAVSFFVDVQEGARLVVDVPARHADLDVAVNGRYETRPVTVDGFEGERTWWLRVPVVMSYEFDATSLLSASGTKRVQATNRVAERLGPLDLAIEVCSRPQPDLGERVRLLTVSLVNRTRQNGNGRRDACSLFQSYFVASVVTPNGSATILPYNTVSRNDLEAHSMDLLYHREPTFAVGHGCSADWKSDEGTLRASSVVAECLPTFEVPSITPDIQRPDGSALKVRMAKLAGLTGEDATGDVSEVVDLYEHWIVEKEAEIPELPDEHKDVAGWHLGKCREALKRMREGLDYLRNDEIAARAFRLANHSILLQQLRSSGPTRYAVYDNQAKRLVYDQPFPTPDSLDEASHRGTWRAFQIAFLLLSAKSAVNGKALDRDIADLIWFPTGGGKTEAYLGLAAFAMFARRLRDPNDVGVNVLMRYTLRLLTAQQFQRSAGLICAMEHLRKQHSQELGSAPFSAGIWLGGSTTPNRRDQARKDLSKMQRGLKDAENKFLLDRCPWCRGQLGPLNSGHRNAPNVIGYIDKGHTVAFECQDMNCEFQYGIPVYVIDEDIYDERPSLVIGTVDKFAQLAWRDDARALFGIGDDGERTASPPGLVIQDELHLISGPLGSMVGLFEAVIEELCTDRRNEAVIKPKIVCSTATIRNYREQVRALYGRGQTELFPPPGLDAGDSFFARYAKDSEGNLQPGRRYVGVLAPGLNSLQTAQVRTYSSLLQSAERLAPVERDPWWTLFCFFNSLNELGNTLSLFQVNIPGYIESIRKRRALSWDEMRRFYNVLELTGRLSSDEVPRALASLSLPADSSSLRPVDVCLASNIIEVGIDIDRLSLMVVAGQPKTTSQYIQVTGRVGRRWFERPGLVVTVFSPTRPRDRSHFERFRTYHQRLYAQVEPTSVTPFSPPALDRALHAAMVSYVRQTQDRDKLSSPLPFPENIIEELREILLPRVKQIDPDELENFESVFDRRAKEWQTWQRTEWSGKKFETQEDVPLLHDAGQYLPPAARKISWPTPTSMRNVDAECVADVTTIYLTEGSD